MPSGAIAGLDGVKGAREGAITAVTMETRKPPRGLAGAPYIEQHRIDLDAITTETLIFEGPATDAVRAFPANVNVVAALSLAGIGPALTRIKLFAVPGQARNQHRITVEGRVRHPAHRGRERAVGESADRPALVPVRDRDAAGAGRPVHVGN